MGRILYVGQDRQILSALRSGQHCLHVCRSGPEVTEDFAAFLPDVLIVDTAFPGCDTAGLLRTARTRGGQTKVLILAEHGGGHIRQLLRHIGPDAVLLQSASAGQVLAALEAFEAEEAAAPETQLAGLLPHLGLDCGGEGFGFLRDSILYKYENPNCLFTADLCVHVAKKHNATVQSVNKTMSRCIRRAWKNRNPLLWESYFPGSADLATCNAFITAVANYLRKEDTSNQCRHRT